MKKLTMSLCMLVGLSAQAGVHEASAPNYVEVLKSRSQLLFTSTDFLNVTAEDGVMVFKDHDHLSNVIVKLSQMTPRERMKFEFGLGFRSLATIEHIVNEAEITNKEVFFAGVDPDLSKEEYEKMGYNYSHTIICEEYLKKGVIEKVIEKDNSESLELTAKIAGYSFVLNENAEVRVGETTYRVKGNTLYVMSQNDEVISTVDFGARVSKMTSNWSNQVDWIYDGPSKRYYYGVVGASIGGNNDYTSPLILSTFYAIARAQNRRFFTWASRVSYMPIYSFSGAWSYTYRAAQCFTCTPIVNPFSLMDNDHTSPYSWNSTSDVYGQTNYLLRYLKPNGEWAVPSPWAIFSPFNVKYTMNFTFSGGSSGYFYTLSN